jgi:Arc/MetJ family transcription regulator
MKIVIDVDDRLIEKGQRITGMTDHTALINEGLRALISRESARRVARLGGSDGRAKAPRRRRPA